MGYGDEIMAAGQAARRFRDDPSMLVAICDKRDRVRWSSIWAGNPAIASPEYVSAGHPVHRIKNAEGCRPYIRYPFTSEAGCRFTEWRARDHVGRLYLTEEERSLGVQLRQELGPFVLIEPDVKPMATQNKQWGRERFAAVVDALPDVTFLRVHGEECGVFPSVRNVRTQNFREACGVLAASDGYVGTEGGMHHAAAALEKPAVVVFGGFISPMTTGYATHINLADTGTGSPCGKWQPCPHCAEAMARITVDDVVAAVHAMRAAVPVGVGCR